MVKPRGVRTRTGCATCRYVDTFRRWLRYLLSEVQFHSVCKPQTSITVATYTHLHLPAPTRIHLPPLPTPIRLHISMVYV